MSRCLLLLQLANGRQRPSCAAPACNIALLGVTPVAAIASSTSASAMKRIDDAIASVLRAPACMRSKSVGRVASHARACRRPSV
eukprot:273342-Chlamydomonas_euryale.AAC.11